MKTGFQVIWLRREAPLKPEAGTPCNGCGVCCAAEPCPVAQFWLWQRSGACRALEWDEQQQRYWCGMVRRPAYYLRWLPQRFEAWFAGRVRRRIAADSACDSPTVTAAVTEQAD